MQLRRRLNVRRKNEEAGQSSSLKPPGVPSFPIRDDDPKDTGCQIRINQMHNGYSLKTGGEPIFYPTIEDCADAVRDGLIHAFGAEQRKSYSYDGR